MVASGELPRKPLCEILTAPDGSKHFIVHREKVNAKMLSAQVDVWWNRKAPKTVGGRRVIEEVIVLRQQDEGCDHADVVCLTQGQAYALIDALCRAIESR